MTIALTYTLADRFLYFSRELTNSLGRVASIFNEKAKCHTKMSSPQKGRHAVLVLDYSGSMLSSDWPPTRQISAQQAALEYCQRLKQAEPDARVAIVAYGTGAQLLCQLTSIHRISKFKSSLGQKFELGSTNSTAGLEIAEYQIRSQLERDRPNQIILLTDGHHNTGQGPMKIAEKIRQIATLECIGIAGTPRSVDEPLLKAIASTYPDGRPRYRWIGDKGELIEHFKTLAGRMALK